jgi:adenine-specific DNA-methyltransferase
MSEIKYEIIKKINFKPASGFSKRADPQANTSAPEEEIDQLVYELYGLSEDEVKIVEGRQ